MEPHTAAEIVAAVAGSGSPIVFWEYFIGQGVSGAFTALFLYLWQKSQRDVHKLVESKAKLAEDKGKEISDLQEKRLTDANTAAEKRLEMQGKLIESTNSVTQALLGLQESIRNMRDRVR